MFDIAEYLLSKPFAVEDYPFGDEVAVFKVAGKMFALLSPPKDPNHVNLKCDPTLAIALRQRYKGVTPGYHMNKTHWNSVSLASDVPVDEIKKQIDHSYDLIIASLPKKLRPAQT